MTTEESEEITKAIWESESRARELLSRGSISHEDVWRLIREAHLRGQRTQRQDMLVNPDQDRVQIWIFGMFCHTTISLAVDATLSPHRVLTNAVGSMAGIVGISKFSGGKLWIEDSAGTVRRRISQDEIKPGVPLDVCQKAHIFDPRRWHGADQQRGVRSTVVGYTARRLQNLDQDVTERLRQMGFKYRRFHPRPAQVAQLVAGAAPAPVGAHLPRPGLPPQATKGTPPPQPLTASGQQARVRPWACSKLPRPTTPPS